MLNLSNRPDYIGVRDDRLFALLEDFGRFKGKLVYAYQASSCVDSTLHRLKHNKDISMKTVNDLCRILNCDIENIVTYVASDEDQKL